jgi:hypothetical protein
MPLLFSREGGGDEFLALAQGPHPLSPSPFKEEGESQSSYYLEYPHFWNIIELSISRTSIPDKIASSQSAYRDQIIQDLTSIEDRGSSSGL